MCSDPAIKTKLHAIASQEVQHYKELYDIVFKDDPAKVWTPMEHIIHHQATGQVEHYHKIKKQKS